MDTDRNVYSSGSPQHTFVINDLQSASQNPSIDWIVVYLHKFMYTSPSEESAFTSLRSTYHPIFDQYGVDLVLQGHQHTYQRTFPIKYNTNNPSDPTKTSTSMNDYSDTEGQVFAIVGTGGQNFDALSGKASYVVSQQASKFGIIDVKITNDGSRLEGKYYTNDGALFDQFSITKANLPPVANNQAVSVTKDTPKSITLTAIDENNDPLIYSIVAPPLHAIISGGTGATRTYTPTTGYVGTDTFTFKANDGTIDSNIANVSITVQEPPQGGYTYTPGLVLTGSNYHNVVNSASLQLSRFTVAAWFKTSSNFGSDAMIVNKGGVGSESSSQNMNYGIWMTSAERIRGGFETSGATDHFVTSANSFNDGQWHYAVVTYDGSTVRLYVDGTQVATKTTSGASPETSGTKPVRVGANSRVTPPSNFFIGEVDEVRVWNNAKTAQQVTDAFVGSITTSGQVLYIPFVTNPPVANSQLVTVNKNIQQTITLTATDPNNDPLTYIIVTAPVNGTLSGTSPNLLYNPNLNHVGSDRFTFKANDGSLDSNIAIISVTVQNGPPVANNQQVSVNKNTQKTISLTATDPNNDPLTYITGATTQQGGTLTPSGSTPSAARTYTPPNPNFLGADSFTFTVNDGTVNSNTATVSINVINQPQDYNYAPGLVLTGTNSQDANSASLTQFSLAAWFRTSSNFGSDAFIANKGGIGSDSSGQNLNYGLWMNSAEQLKAGFETSSGSDQYVTSINTYNDGQWHYAVVTNSGTNLVLYIDGVQVATKATSGATPENNGKPFRVGANARVNPPTNFFIGEVDEIRAWNDDLTATEVSAAFQGTNFNSADQVLHLDFSSVSLTGTYNFDPSLSLSGPE
ncbi:MAG TPA: LamG-like jellyroll fold domain-containing protein [Nitrososphaeraceae archaeon]|nr:LamG-like jellyroll fold domain-containing protein [Nitrososphaeraceae archaeon]